MGIFLGVIGILMMVGGSIFADSSLKEAPIYLKTSFLFVVISISLMFSILGIGLDSIMGELRKVQNQLLEMQKDFNSPFGKAD